MKAISVAGDAAGGPVRRWLQRRRFEKAIRRALSQAVEATRAAHASVVADLRVDFDLLDPESLAELDRLVVPGPPPRVEALAEAYVRVLAPALELEDHRERARRLVPVFRTFLTEVDRATAREPALAETLDRVHRARTAEATTYLAARAGASPGGDDTQRRYLEWVVDVNRWIRTVGMVGTHQVQLRLDEVFVSLQAERDVAPGDRTWQWLDEERTRLEARLAAGEIDAEQLEFEVESLERNWGLSTVAGGVARAGAVDLDAHCCFDLGR